eukprot:snap_masked-scaffold_81-processed-gene-0.44-mRNA-1 protein AED:0.01 eAED:0.01 QI:0/-1/0/1/-1/1/1/0/370
MKRISSLSNHLSTSSTSISHVILNQTPKCSTISLNRPDKLNSLNLPMIASLRSHYLPLITSKSPILLISTSPKAFCAGGDVASIQQDLLNEKFHGPKNFFYEEYQVNHLIHKLKVSHVAIWDGIVMGGGVGLSVHGSHRICTEKTLFAMPETAIGLFPDVGLTHKLTRTLQGDADVGYALGQYLGVSGVRLKAEDLIFTGLATHFVPSEKVGDLVKEIENSGDVDGALGKYAENVGSGGIEKNVDVIRECFGKENENVEDVLQKLDGNGTEFAKKTKATIEKMSPMSVKLSFKAIKKHSEVGFEEALKSEYRLSQACMFHEASDFVEGIRAVLIDKDQKPNWKAKSVQEVKQATIEQFFEPAEKELMFLV